MEIARTGNTHPDFKTLVTLLDAELDSRYGKNQAQYTVHNKIDPVPTAVVGYEGAKPVACGCFKELDAGCVEIKRMFVKDRYRGQGFSKDVLNALEAWAGEIGYTSARLETGKGQPEAIGLYHAFGYTVIENYGPYSGMKNSICFEKQIGEYGNKNR
jgi:putative acetyltransferase